MNIIHILNELKFSGAEIMYVSAVNEFKRMGCQLYVVNTSLKLGEYTSEFEKAGYIVLHWPYSSSSFLDTYNYTKQVINYLKQNSIDVVHIHASSMRGIMAYSAWRAGCRAVYTFHNVFPSRNISYLYHILQRLIIKKIFNCKFQTISDSVYINEKRKYLNNTELVYNWYNHNLFFTANNQEKKKTRRELDIDENTLVLISVGGCSPIKQHSDIIKALPIILEVFPNTIYLHLGSGLTLPNEQQLARTLNVENYIRFEGNKIDVRKYLISSDIYLMPSKFEGIPITTIEALACGIPAILYNVPGLRDFNKSAECSLLIEKDYRKLAENVIKLFQNKEKQLELAINGKLFVDKNFSMKTNTQKIYNLYL